MGDREPCPHRIVGDVGGAYAFGLVGGGIWHSVKGARNAPKGQRWSGSLKAVTVSCILVPSSVCFLRCGMFYMYSQYTEEQRRWIRPKRARSHSTAVPWKDLLRMAGCMCRRRFLLTLCLQGETFVGHAREYRAS